MTVRVGVLRLDGVSAEEALSALLPQVSPRRKERVQCFARAEDRLRSLAAEVLLGQMLREEGLAGAEHFPLMFEAGERGKPYLAQLPEVQFNLSHSGDLAACAVGRLPVGVDVQRFAGIREGVARRCFTAEEAAQWERLPESEKEKAFCQLWALKESFLKATGQGMRIPMRRVQFSGSGELTVRQDWDDWNYLARVWETGMPYALAVCSGEPAEPALSWYCLQADGTITPVRPAGSPGPADISR